mmetsp:Transcript_10396/g.20037  ORF Transcript_10396/g.20037 Transcript_10396/m.20037 type:complete len:96 (-) Transcript_10396:914-1201(-)
MTVKRRNISHLTQIKDLGYRSYERKGLQSFRRLSSDAAEAETYFPQFQIASVGAKNSQRGSIFPDIGHYGFDCLEISGLEVDKKHVFPMAGVVQN